MSSLNVVVSTLEPSACAVDALVVNVFEDEKTSEGPLAALDQKLQGAISRLADLGEREGKLYHTTFLASTGQIAAPRVLLVGSGKRSEFDNNRARHVAGAAVRALMRRPISTVGIWMRGPANGASLAEAVATGTVLATFEPGEYKTKPEEPMANLTSLAILESSAERSKGAETAAKRGVMIGEAANFARHLANAPGNVLTPEKLAAEAARAAAEAGFSIDVLDRERMAALGMGALLGVAEGSEQPPMTIVMSYKGRGGDGVDVALVGKGVTFDTGGISI
ncbi:MAG: M17 family peptidase N-terminal domain-containing protein, partial [Candidatus Dormibacteraceae bacterium]